MSADLVFKRVVAGTYRASMDGTDVTGHIVYKKDVGWFIDFSDGSRFIARTRADARFACHAYLLKGSIPNDFFGVVSHSL